MDKGKGIKKYKLLVITLVPGIRHTAWRVPSMVSGYHVRGRMVTRLTVLTTL